MTPRADYCQEEHGFSLPTTGDVAGDAALLRQSLKRAMLESPKVAGAANGLILVCLEVSALLTLVSAAYCQSGGDEEIRGIMFTLEDQVEAELPTAEYRTMTPSARPAVGPMVADAPDRGAAAEHATPRAPESHLTATDLDRGSEADSAPAQSIVVTQLECTHVPCPAPLQFGRWELVIQGVPPLNGSQPRAGHPEAWRGRLVGALVQEVTLELCLGNCSVTHSPAGHDVLSYQCGTVAETHYELYWVRENDTWTDFFELKGANQAFSGFADASVKFLPAQEFRTPEWNALRDMAFWDAQGQQGTGWMPMQGNIPHMKSVRVGSALWSHEPPPGWDSDFGGRSINGGYHGVELYWLCCGALQLSEGECNP